MRDLNDRLAKQQRIIDQLHEQIKKLMDGAGGGGCDTNVIIQKVCHCPLFRPTEAAGQWVPLAKTREAWHFHKSDEKVLK